MARLTYRDESGKAWAKLSTSVTAEESMKFGRLSLDRLAAYEDTGLEPGEIQEAVNLFPWEDADIPTELKNWVERCTWHVKKCNELRKELNTYQVLGTVEELAELVKAKQDGRCVVLPCKVGDTVISYGIRHKVYHISFQMDENRDREQQIRLYATPEDDENEDDIHFWIDDIGKIVFLTPEEAKAALKGAEHDD